ncbi:MAG TPA: 4Fe-4S dicluster domain-containing protein [Syntrophales bacterium]|nr:4Fe-4S dicluster domain-containing protein [Syntrophales bacterium]
MAHHSLKPGYADLVERLNRFPQGAPPSNLLYRILQVLFTEKEASLVSLLPIKPFSAEKAARIWQVPLSEAQKTLDALADRAILLDMTYRGETHYVLPPPMAGFFEFSLMRLRGDIDQKLLSELFYQYLDVEEDFARALFGTGETQLGRIFVQEPALTEENTLHVLDYELASEVIKTADSRGVGLCYCRHKMSHLGRACQAPLDICMTFNTSARSLIKHGYARSIGREECLDLLDQAWSLNLVQFGENVQKRVSFMCHCCGCCCEAMIAARRFGFLQPVHTTNFIASSRPGGCTGCGTCVAVCPVNAVSLVSSQDPHHPKRRTVQLAGNLCLGCGVCVRNCPAGVLFLSERGRRTITPVDSVHRTVMMAIERGKLPDLIFDNRVLFSHRAMAAMLGAILKLPPVKQVLASRQLRSRFVDYLLSQSRPA